MSLVLLFLKPQTFRIHFQMSSNNDIRILHFPQFTCISHSILTVTDRLKSDIAIIRLNLIIYSFEREAKMKAEPDL